LGEINSIMDAEGEKTRFLEETMKKYGLAWTDMGERARAAHAATEAAGLEKEFRALLEAGVEVNNIMRHMGDNISDFVLQANKSGTEVPESFRDVIQTAIDAGEIFTISTDELKRLREEAQKLGKPFDDSKYKINEIKEAGVTFGTTMETATQNVASAIERLISVIENRLGPAIEAIPDADIAIRARYIPPKNIPRGYDIDVPDIPEPTYMAGGGRVIAFPGRARGSDTVPTWTTPGERLLTVGQNRAYEREMTTSHGGQDVTLIVPLVQDGVETARVVVPHLHEEIARQSGRSVA
jgi:hypothetical protein